MSHQSTTLADDLLVGVRAIARFTGEPERRVRHLISHHKLPAFKRGGLFYARKSLLNAYYSGEGITAGSECATITPRGRAAYASRNRSHG